MMILVDKYIEQMRIQAFYLFLRLTSLSVFYNWSTSSYDLHVSSVWEKENRVGTSPRTPLLVHVILLM